MYSVARFRDEIIPLIFGISLMGFGCENFAANAAKVSAAYDAKISAPTTQAVAAIGQTAGVIAATTPGTPLGNGAALVMTVAGAILALDRIFSLSLKTVANAAAGKPIDSGLNLAATNSNDQNQPPLSSKSDGSKGGGNTT